tara:strand:- start:77 stop:493 length:417 start_codon:yes stop_codon:yes gene_type:complete
MPNLISVTTHGTPQDLVKGVGLVRGLQEAVPEPVRRYAGDAIAAFRDLQTIQSANPLAYIAKELAFPEPLAHGTLTGAIKKHGYEAAPSQVFTGPPESYKYKRDETSGLLQIDPAVQRALDIQKSQMDAGISGTFLPN